MLSDPFTLTLSKQILSICHEENRRRLTQKGELCLKCAKKASSLRNDGCAQGKWKMRIFSCHWQQSSIIRWFTLKLLRIRPWFAWHRAQKGCQKMCLCTDKWFQLLPHRSGWSIKLQFWQGTRSIPKFGGRVQIKFVRQLLKFTSACFS